MERLKVLITRITTVLCRWIEFSALALNLVLTIPAWSFFILLIIAFPFGALYYAITHPSLLGLLIIISLVGAGVTVIWRIVHSDDDEPPVKRGRKILRQDDAQRVSRTRLDRSTIRSNDN